MILLNFATKINGTSTVAEHDKWITCEAVDFNVGRSITRSGGGADRDTSNPQFSEVQVTKATDCVSAELFFQAACGKSLGKAELHFVQTGGGDAKGQAFLKMELEGAIISNYRVSSNGDRPTESFSINFTKISYQFDSFDGDKVTTGTPKKWDVMKNEVWA
jgi:type VI secretion system secreted protein Hcp